MFDFIVFDPEMFVLSLRIAQTSQINIFNIDKQMWIISNKYDIIKVIILKYMKK